MVYKREYQLIFSPSPHLKSVEDFAFNLRNIGLLMTLHGKILMKNAA